MRLRKSEGELREGIGNVESRGAWVSYEVGEAEEADGASLLGLKRESGSVAL